MCNATVELLLEALSGGLKYHVDSGDLTRAQASAIVNNQAMAVIGCFKMTVVLEPVEEEIRG